MWNLSILGCLRDWSLKDSANCQIIKSMTRPSNLHHDVGAFLLDKVSTPKWITNQTTSKWHHLFLYAVLILEATNSLIDSAIKLLRRVLEFILRVLFNYPKQTPFIIIANCQLIENVCNYARCFHEGEYHFIFLELWAQNVKEAWLAKC